MAFSGFSDETLAFLAELADNNDRAWFAENKPRYERVLLERQKGFIAALAKEFEAIDPHVHCEPAVDRSIFRINRDTRFSRDKSPYKTHSDMWFWAGDDRKASPGYFVRIVPGEVWAGAGQHWIDPPKLAKLRAAIAAEDTGAEFAAIIADLEADGFRIGERTFARVPRGFAADHPRADLLRLSVVHAIEEGPVPPEFESEAFVGWCLERFLRTRPLVEWLAKNL